MLGTQRSRSRVQDRPELVDPYAEYMRPPQGGRARRVVDQRSELS